MAVKRLTKASVLRALRRQGACTQAVTWFQHQPSMAVAWGKLLRYGGPMANNRHARRRCWLQKQLGLHIQPENCLLVMSRSERWRRCSAYPATYREIRRAAIRKGWTR